VIVVARRAKNIRFGSKIAISVPYDQIDLVEIAEQELLQKKLPGVKVVRNLPDGTQEEYDPNDLLW
jgi:DNA-directed RNA polymerase subunit K/omega